MSVNDIIMINIIVCSAIHFPSKFSHYYKFYLQWMQLNDLYFQIIQITYIFFFQYLDTNPLSNTERFITCWSEEKTTETW